MSDNISLIYGSKDKWYKNRKEKIVSSFKEEFGATPTHFFSSPGRVEILGNHTDHNNGLVMVSAIDLDIFAGVRVRNDNKIMLKSVGYRMNDIELNDLSIHEDEKDTSNALVRGVVSKLKELGHKVGGFEAFTDSNIFKGAGLSSSAAFELLIAQIENVLYNESKISRVEMAKIGQFAENVYYGKPSGLLDQMGVSIGGFNFIDFKYEKMPSIENFNFQLKDYRVVLINTGGSHGNLTSYYASIKDDMKKVAKFLGKDSLREVSEEDFYKAIPRLKRKIGGRAIMRSIHFFNENKRVLTAYKALKNDDIETFLKMINESGESSYKLLQNCFVQKDSKQGIALALALSKMILKNGAVRVHGGGFKGTVIAYVHVSEQLNYIEKMKKVFGERNVVKLNLRPVGATLLEEEKDE
ncbi:MAG: galactokinase [Gammaproteobacteria bacterium]|nr:galactokinase [Gammaproteobacteria bacterium]